MRIVRVDEATVAIDPTGKQAGRGAYVALDPEAVKGAAKKHLIESALSVKLDPDFIRSSLTMWIIKRRAKNFLEPSDAKQTSTQLVGISQTGR